MRMVRLRTGIYHFPDLLVTTRMSEFANVRFTHAQLARQHCPSIHLHVSEQYFPSDIRDWLGETTNSTYEQNGRLFETRSPLDRNSKAEPFKKNVPILYTVGRFPDGNVQTITYNIWYRYNGCKRVAGVYPTGGHWGDLEQFVVEFTMLGELAYYGLSFHGDMSVSNMHRDATLLNVTEEATISIKRRMIDLEVDSRGHPIVYAALNSHALYPCEGAFVRFGGFGNDETSRGHMVTPVPICYDGAPRDLLEYSGNLGEDGVSSIKGRYDVNGLPHLRSRAKALPTRIWTWIPDTGFLLWLIPSIVCWCVTSHLDGQKRALISIAAFLIGIHAVFWAMFVIGPKMGLPMGPQRPIQYVFPLSVSGFGPAWSLVARR